MMNQVPDTSWSLVERARRSDNGEAIGELAVIYAPYIYTVAKRFKADPNDAMDVAQQFIADTVLTGRLTQTFDPRAGKFRHYLFTAVRNACRKKPRKSLPSCPYDSKLYVPVDRKVGQPAMPEEVVWAQTMLAMAVDRAREQLQKNGKEEIWELYLDQVIRPVLFRLPKTPRSQLSERYGLTGVQIAARIESGKRAIKKAFARISGSLDHQVLMSGSRTEEILRVLLGPGGVNPMDPRLLSRFGLDEVSSAIFLSGESLIELISTRPPDDSESGRREQWRNLLGRSLREFAIASDSTTTVADVLSGKETSQRMVTALRNTAKSCIAAENGWIHSDIAKVLYTLTVAVEHVHCRASTSSLDATQLLHNLHRIADEPMLDPASRQLIQRAIGIIRD